MSRRSRLRKNGTVECQNCGYINDGEYCSRRGQPHGDLRHSLSEFLGEVIESLTHFDSRGVFAASSRCWSNRAFSPRNTGPDGAHLTQTRCGNTSSRASSSSWYSRGGRGYWSGRWKPEPPQGAPIKAADFVAESQKDPPHNCVERRLQHGFARIVTGSTEEVSREFGEHLSHAIPKALFFLLPFFAFLLMVLFRKPPRYYVEHLVFALHTQTFWFLAFLTILLALRPFHTGFRLLTAAFVPLVYLFFALQRAYAMPLLQTVLRYGVLVFLYGLALVVALIGSSLFAISQL